MGIAVFPSDSKDPQSLLSHAEAAMRRAKEGARNGFEFYSKALSERDFVAFLKREQKGREVWLLEEKSE